MSRTGYSKLLGFYFLGISVVLIYIFLFAMTAFHLFFHLSLKEVHDMAQPLIFSLKSVVIPVFLSLPFALAICLFILKMLSSRHVEKLQSFLLFIDRSPLILFGLVFFVIFSEKDTGFYFTGSFVACSKISRRWIQQFKEVTPLELETVQSLGMNFFETLKVLYFKRFLFVCMGHVFSVTGFLLTVVTPFIYFSPLNGDTLDFLSLSFFLQLGGNSEPLSLMVLVLFVIYILRFLFDFRVGFIEVEHG